MVQFLIPKASSFNDWNQGPSETPAETPSLDQSDNGSGSGSGGGGTGGWYGGWSGGSGGDSSHEYTYYSEADDDSEWEDYFRAELVRQEAGESAWDAIRNAERNILLLDKQKEFYDDQFENQNNLIDQIYKNANAMASRTSDNDFVKNLQDFQNMSRNAATSMGGQYGTWAQSLNNILDEGWAQQNANNAYTLQYNLQDAQDNRDNQLNDFIKSYNNQMLDLESNKMNIDANLKSAIAQNKRNLTGNLATLTEYDPRSQYLGDWGGLQDAADDWGWFKFDEESIDGVTMRDYLGNKKEYVSPTLVDNMKKGDQIAKKLAGYSSDNGVLERLTGSYSSERR